MALTQWEDIQRRLTLRWGVVPVIVRGLESVEDFFSIGQRESENFLQNDSKGTVVLVAGTPLGVAGSTNMMRVLELT